MADLKNETSDVKINSIKKRAIDNGKVIEKIVDQLVSRFGNDLDDFVLQVKKWLDNKDALEDHEIESITIRIPVFMYFAVSGLENLGIQRDSAKAIKMEAFNDAVMKIEGTVRDKESFAENDTLHEYLVEMAFDRAYKKLKAKVDTCDQICQASRKVLTKRISELDINRMEGNRNTGSTRREYEETKKMGFRERVED